MSRFLASPLNLLKLGKSACLKLRHAEGGLMMSIIIRLQAISRALTGMLPVALLASTVLLHQNCTPANFTTDKSRMGREGTIDPICPDDSNPLCGPPPSCEGFEVQPLGDVVLPFGVTSDFVTLRGTLGQAPGPMQWEIPSAVPSTAIGETVQVRVMPRSAPYVATARSSNNLCSRSFQFRVSQATCTNPSATQIMASVVTPVDERRVNSPIQFRVSNFGNLNAVEVSFDNRATYSPVNRQEFTHTFPQTGNFIVWLRAKDQTCGNTLEAQLPLTILPEVCVPDVTSLMAERLTTDPRSGSPVEFRLITDFALLENNRVEVICDPGQVSYFGPSDRIRCSYPASQTDQQKTVQFKAIGKKCRNNLATQLDFTLRKVCDPLPPIQIAVQPGQTIEPTTRVQFTVQNAAQYAQAGLTFRWNLGNGSSGTGTQIPSTTYPLLPNEEDLAATTGIVRTARFLVESSNPTLCVPNEVQIPMTIRLNPVTQEFVVGVSTSKPPVKMFFIVDNSNTMRDDQVRLSQSFATLFSPANVNNLTQFNTSTWVFNTAQKSDRYMSVPPNYQNPYPSTSELEQYYGYNAATRLTPEQVGAQFSLDRLMTPLLVQGYDPNGQWTWYQQSYISTLEGARALNNGVDAQTPSATYGHIAGDVLGYRNSAGASDPFYSFEIMPVSLIRAGPGGSSATPSNVSRFSTLPMGASQAAVNQYAQDFRERVEILNPFRYSSEKWDPILTQHESGLCAAARILQSNQYIQPGDQASFVIVSDETDQDPMGDNCLATSGQVLLEHGRCSQMGTRFLYQTPPVCRLDYPNAVNLSFSFREFSGTMTYQQCVQTDDQGNCVRYQEIRNTIPLPGTSGDPQAYCNTWQQQNPGETCSWYQRGSSLQRPISASQPTTGACDSATEQYLISNYPTYIRGSCQVAGYAITQTETNLGANSTEASCRAELLRRQPLCSDISNPLVCRSFLFAQQDQFEVPQTGLSCMSPCPSGMSQICGTRTIWEHLDQLSPGTNCQVLNPNSPMTDPRFAGPELTFAPNVPIANRCESNRVWSPTRTSSQNQNIHVAQNGQGQRMSLKDYILGRTNELAAQGLKPTFSTFTLRPGDTPGAGESIGSAYIDLVNAVGMPSLGFSLNQQDFSYPMQVLSQYIRTVLSTVFDFNLPSGTQIRRLLWERSGQPAQPVRSDSYQLGGGRIEFVDVDNAMTGVQIWLSNGTKITLQANDRFRLTYY